ncbi:MAG: DUF2243 domain-containing protein, partial [Dermatophilaceae bacterium]
SSLFVLVDLRRWAPVRWMRWVGGLLVGAGGFQLYDGLVHHKLFRLHQIRYGVDLVPYDAVWNVVAAVMILLGAALLTRSRHRPTRV